MSRPRLNHAPEQNAKIQNDGKEDVSKNANKNLISEVIQETGPKNPSATKPETATQGAKIEKTTHENDVKTALPKAQVLDDGSVKFH